MKGFAGAVRSKAVVAMAIALLVVAILFYSSPVAAYWIDSTVSPTVSRQAGGSQLNVTITIGKVTDEVLSNYSDVTAMLMYQNSTKSDAVSASNCSVTSVGFTQGYTFHGYGYMRDLYEGYGYGYLGGYGIGETSMACLFSFTIPSGAVVVGMDNVTVNGVTLGNSSASMYGSTFIQFASNQVYSYKTITAGGPADSYSFSRYNETRPVMNVTIPASITVNGTGSGTFGMSLDVIPPLGEVLTKTQGPVFLMGPSGTTFSPNLTLVIDYSLMTGSVTTIESLAASGYLQVKRCNAAGASCENLAYTINTSAKTLTFSTDHFSTFTMYDGTPSGSTGGNTGSGSGGGSFAGKTLPPASKVEQVTPTPAPVPPAQQPAPPVVKPTEPEKPAPTPTTPKVKTATQETPTTIEQPPAPVNNGIWGIIAAAGVVGVGAGAVALVVIVGAAWYVLKGKKGKN